MRVDFYIARRLRLSGEGSRRSVMSTRISTVGVALSVCIMLLTIAVVTGFKQQIVHRVSGFEPQISVATTQNRYQDIVPFTLDSQLKSIVDETLPEAVTTLSVTHPAMLKTDDAFAAVVIRGYSDGYDWSFVAENLVDGGIEAFTADTTGNSIIISRQQADALRLSVGDRISAAFPIDEKMRIRKFDIAAIYESNFGDYDENVAYASIGTLRRLMSLDENQATQLEISGLDDSAVDGAHIRLEAALQDAYFAGLTDTQYSISDLHQTCAAYFSWLSLLDTNVLVIIIIMSAISVFTLIASLFILILERVAMIGTMKTIGASDSLIRRIFILLASKIVIRGLLMGNVIALAIIISEHSLHYLPLDPHGYFLSFVPADISVGQVVTLNAAALAVSLLVMIIPSMIISRLSPAKTVRFE